MEDSILKSTKKILGLDEDYTVFDLDIITHINATFSNLNQLGVGPVDGFFIEDASATWTGLDIPPKQLNMVKTYMYLKVRILFDVPATSFHIEAINKQIEQMEWRLTVFKDEELAQEEVV